MTTATAKDSKKQKKTALTRLTTRIPQDTRERVDAYVRTTGQKLQFVVAAALEDYVTRIGNPAR